MKKENKVKVLIVEDESIVALDISRALKLMGFEIVACVRNCEDALACVRTKVIDIVLMDINLGSEKDGIFTAKHVKKIKNLPIIFLTAFSDEETIDRAVSCDPVGYLTKPFNKNELNSTIKIAINRLEKREEKLKENGYELLYDKFYYDKESQSLYYDDIPIKLSKNEKILLTLLVNTKGKILTFEEIENYIWPERVVCDSTTRSLIHRLRCKTDPNLIETIPGFGCKLK